MRSVFSTRPVRDDEHCHQGEYDDESQPKQDSGDDHQPDGNLDHGFSSPSARSASEARAQLRSRSALSKAFAAERIVSESCLM